MCGSGVVQVRPKCVWAWVGTPTATIVSSTFRSMVARLWFRCGSGVVQAWFRCGSDVDRNVTCKHDVFHAFLKGASIMVQVLFMCGSGVVQVRLGVLRNTSCDHRVFHVSLNGGSTMVQVWFRRGSGVVQVRLRRGPERNMQTYCLPRVFSRMVPLWYRCGACVVHAWFRCGPGAFGCGSEHQQQPSCFHVSFNGGSTMVQVWFRRGSGAAQTCIGT